MAKPSLTKRGSDAKVTARGRAAGGGTPLPNVPIRPAKPTKVTKAAKAPPQGTYVLAGGGNAGSVRYEFRRALSNTDLRSAIAHREITGDRIRALRVMLDLTVRDVAHVLGMSERNVTRREQGEAMLSVADADRAYRLARVADLAVELIGDADRAKKWLKTPHRYLGGETPIAALETEIGTDLVIESLYAIAYGGVA